MYIAQVRYWTNFAAFAGICLAAGSAAGAAAADPGPPSTAQALSHAEAAPAPAAWRLVVGPLRLDLADLTAWNDELFFHGWRIQRDLDSDACRLLDEDDETRASGTFEQCRDKLQEIRRQEELPPMRGRVVILLHGLGGMPLIMAPLASYLERWGDYQALNVSYSSRQGDLARHARSLASIVDNLPDVEQIDFVAHSLGNVVVRYYMGDAAAAGRPDPRIKRFVMLAPPNYGAQRRAEWSDNILFEKIMGKSAVQLGTQWESIAGKLAVPPCEFGVIAGGRNNDEGHSSKLPGDDDGVLSVATTRLPGAADFALVRATHTLMLISPTVHRYTLSFLKNGYFRTAAERQPITD